MVCVEPFFRKGRFCRALDVGGTTFDDLRKAGEIPPPDGWIGPRIPF